MCRDANIRQCAAHTAVLVLRKKSHTAKCLQGHASMANGRWRHWRVAKCQGADVVLMLWQTGLIRSCVLGIELMMPVLRSIRVAIPRCAPLLYQGLSAAAIVTGMCRIQSTGGACRPARLRGWRRRCATCACSAARASPRCERPCRIALRLICAQQLCCAARSYTWCSNCLSCHACWISFASLCCLLSQAVRVHTWMSCA